MSVQTSGGARIQAAARRSHRRSREGVPAVGLRWRRISHPSSSGCAPNSANGRRSPPFSAPASGTDGCSRCVWKLDGVITGNAIRGRDGARIKSRIGCGKSERGPRGLQQVPVDEEPTSNRSRARDFRTSWKKAASSRRSSPEARRRNSLKKKKFICWLFIPINLSSYRPPATSMNVPVEYDASSDSSHRIARATSIASPPRCIGSVGPRRSTRPGSPPSAWISV